MLVPLETERPMTRAFRTNWNPEVHIRSFYGSEHVLTNTGTEKRSLEGLGPAQELDCY